MSPNLFNFATSELSQDAFLCWLISWSDNKYKDIKPNLHCVAKALVSEIYKRAGLDVPENFYNVVVKKQVYNIDVLCVVDNQIAILIEDKVGTIEHSNQLERYKTHLYKNFPSDKCIPVYIQTGDQSDYDKVKSAGYHVLLRKDLLAILNNKNGEFAREESDILKSYYEYLFEIEEETQSYRVLPLDQWESKSRTWIGFYLYLKGELERAGWSLVPNPSGGFFGFWWYSREDDECGVYLQLEENKCCFKIAVNETANRADLRNSWSKKIISKCSKYGLKVKRPDRFGNGWYMTVAIFHQEYRAVDANGCINLESTLEILKRAQDVIDDCFEEV